ncbi:unnamed protein product [Symbiodinium necroappetens]|uniref:Uncharacterized protein n=1 Tax=Symbiodinium necroappetens TaxID=1628268 RepID=A0A812YLB4_9DINO|nr:unnamed protein product [Symbiodinium necroappetens]
MCSPRCRINLPRCLRISRLNGETVEEMSEEVKNIVNDRLNTKLPQLEGYTQAQWDEWYRSRGKRYSKTDGDAWSRSRQALKQDGASSRARFCAHLLGEPFDTCLLDDDGQSFLNWLVECGFQKVLLDWSHLSSSPKVKERTDAEVDRCAQGLLKLMNDFELVFVLSIRDNAYSNRQGERLLDRLLREAKPAKIQVLYNSSRGLGEKSTVYKCPESRYQDRVVGYAGGLGPGNVLQQLHEMRWVVPQGRHVFIEAQSGVRDKKKDEFSIDLCRDFAETVAKSSFNPAKGGEVYPQFDGSLVLGDSDTKVLYPDTDYEVTGIVQLTFSVKPAGTEQTANDANVFIAGSIAERYFELADIGGGLLPPQLTNDRPGVKKACTPSSPVSADIIRDYLQPPRRSTLKIVRSPAANGPPYHGNTPLDYLKRLLESHAWMIAKTCPKRDGEHATEILKNWSQGLVASNDAGVGGQGHMSVASAGFGSRAEPRKVFRGSERDSLAGRGIAIVSIPGADPELYNTVIRICLEDGMHFAVVWLSDWGDAWFYAWLRSVTDALLHGCVPVVLTWSDGKIGRAQSAEVLALELQPQHLLNSGTAF